MQGKKIQIVGNILDALKNHYGLRTYRELAEFLDVKEGTLHAWKARGSIGDVDAILAKCKGVNYEWLKTGQGEMFTGAEQGESRVTEKAPAYEKPFSEPIQKTIEVLEKNPERAWELYALILERVDKKK